MTPEAQRIAVAKACGWKPKTYEVPADWMIAEAQSATVWLAPGHEDTSDNYGYFLPDYLNDLNAMYEAEKTMTQAQCWVFNQGLVQAVFEDVRKLSEPPALRWDWHTTAAQRAEAFLKALNLYIV